MPWRMPASNMGSPASALKLRPLGWTVMVKVMAWVSSGKSQLNGSADFAFKPEPPGRAAGALSP